MKEKLENLKSDLNKVSGQLEQLIQLKFKLIGAIEILESLDNESAEEKIEDGDSE